MCETNKPKKLSEEELLDICGGKDENYWAFFGQLLYERFKDGSYLELVAAYVSNNWSLLASLAMLKISEGDQIIIELAIEAGSI